MRKKQTELYKYELFRRNKKRLNRKTNLLKKRSKVIIEEVPNKDATPRYERLPEGEKSLLIKVEQLANADEDMPALIPDKEDSDEEEFKEELLIECLQENDTLTSDVLIRAKTSISQSLAHEHAAKEEKTFKDLVPEEYHNF